MFSLGSALKGNLAAVGYNRRIPSGGHMPNILFVCTGNMHRSPIAAAVFQRDLSRNLDDRSDWQVLSAGTWATADLPAEERTRRFAEKLGLDLSQHRSQRIDENLLANADLVVVMESGHKEALGVEFPKYKDRVVLLSELIPGPAFDLPDPDLVRLEKFNQKLSEVVVLVEKAHAALCAAARGS